ncbi:cuticle protein 16.5-like [Cylas formicarius]|uniref:cuticle protein 16.5-like n=1 Tax=Cylas formicarius TaxID=197179 RepID=UPI0029585DCC|nr:cuticle protein 16.5-like [Cylas formicarius]
MNSYALVAFFAFAAVANAGILAPAARIIQGPSSRTTVVGPDGSAISSVAPAGQIVHEESVGVVAETAPVVAGAPVLSAYSAPVVSAPVVSAYSAPVVSAYSAPVVSAPVVSAYSAPLVSAPAASLLSADTVVAGPSGTVVAGRSVATPVVAW